MASQLGTCLRRGGSRGVIVAMLVLNVLGCDSVDGQPATCPYVADQGAPRGNRTLSIALTPAGGDTDLGPAFRAGVAVGMQEPGDINLDWTTFEVQPGVFADPDGYLRFANGAFASSASVSLTLGIIQTTYLSVPSDLAGLAFDNPAVIARAISAVDYLFAALPDLNIGTLAVGNEVDIYLADDAAGWLAYTTLVEQVRAHVARTHPGTRVGVKATLDGLVRTHATELASINSHTDIVIATFYPLTENFAVLPLGSIRTAFADLVTVASGKPIQVAEVGVPSSTVLGSSDSQQAEFVREVFAAWDMYATEITSVCFVWLNDLSDDLVASLVKAYMIDDPSFAAFLGSLGLRHADGTEKPAFACLRDEASVRGW